MAEAGNIKTFESPVDRLTPTETGAQAFEMEGRHVAGVYHQTGESIGGAMATVGQQIEQHDTTIQTADLMKNMSDLEVQKQTALLNAKKTMDLNDPDAVNKFMSSFDDQTQAITSKTYTSRAYDTMTRMMSDFNSRTKNDFLGYQSNAQANEAMANFENAGNNYATILGQDPSQAKNVVSQIQLGSQNLQAEHRATLALPVVQHALDTGAEVMTGKVEGLKVYDPQKVQQTIDYINDPKNGYIADPNVPGSVGMSAAKYTEVMNRLNNARRTGTHETVAGIELDAPAMLKQMSQTGVVPKDYDAAIAKATSLGTPEGDALAAKMVQERRNTVEGAYPARQLLSQTPADKVAEAVDGLKNASLNSNLSKEDIAVNGAKYEAALKLDAERRKAFDGSDPSKQSGWMIENNPAVQNAYDAWRKNPNDPAAFAAYANKSMAMQRFLEPSVLPSVTTPDMENDAKKIMNEISRDPQGGGAARSVTDLNHMATTYGAAWPLVVNDLAKKKIFTGNQLVMAGLNSPSQAVWRQDLATASALGEKGLEDRSGMSRAAALKTVRDEFAPLESSMSNVSNAPELLNTYMDAAAQLVQLHKMDEAHDLVKTMFLDNFQFVGPGNSIRLGNSVSSGDAIGDGASAVLHDIGNHDLVVPHNDRLGSINAKEAWSDAIGANGVWNTSPTGNSAILYDGHGNPVMERRNGKVVAVELSFDELARLGQTKGLTKQETEEQESHVK